MLIAAAIDRHWLDPGEKLGCALNRCEALLNLYDSRDRTLLLYPLLFTGDGRRALGRAGLLPKDHSRLGPVAARYSERDVYPQLGREHTFLRAVAHPEVAQLLAPYTWATEPGSHRSATVE